MSFCDYEALIALSTYLAEKCRLSKPIWALCATYLETLDGTVFRVLADGFFIKEVITVHDDTGKNVQCIYTFANGALHSLHDLPAKITFTNGTWSSKMWFQYGIPHRDHNQPACIDLFDEIGVMMRVMWMKHGNQEKYLNQVYHDGLRQHGLEWFRKQGVSEKDLRAEMG